MGLTKVNHGMTKLPFSNRNKIINGNFDVWQRGTSQTSNGYGSADRWKNVNGGSTKTVSRQSFSVGEQFSSGQPTPTHFSRTVVSSVVGGANFVAKQHLIEGVPTLAGKKATLSLWAKADSSKNIAIEFVQNFGTGGSPSSGVNTIGTRKLALTTIWQRFVVTIDVPSISGKVLGTDGNDYLGLNIWFDAGSNLNSRTDSLGQQSGTFDIAQVQLEEGEVATPFEERHIADELMLCQRYYEKNTDEATPVTIFGLQGVGCEDFAISNGGGPAKVRFKVTKRIVPSILTYDTLGNSGCYIETATGSHAAQGLTTDSISSNGFKVWAALEGKTITRVTFHWVADAEL